MVEDDVERVDWGNDDDEPQATFASYSNSPREAMSGYGGEDAEDAVSLGGDDEDEREFYAHHADEQVSDSGDNIFAKSGLSHSHPTKREPQRQSATSSQHARTPSQTKNPDSPNNGLRRTNSANALSSTHLVHGLPPKPVLVPPRYRPPSPAGPGTLASSMVHRPKTSNGLGKPHAASDGGDPLPPDWEVRYPRDGTKEVYFYNVKTEQSTWERPKLLPSGRSSPTKDRDNGNPQYSDRHSPDHLDVGWSEPTRVPGQAPRPPRRDAVSSRNVSPPSADGDLTYQDRHYRPGETDVSMTKADAGDRRGDRTGTRSTYLSGAPFGRTRSPSPQTNSGSRRRTRSTSPFRERSLRRDLSPVPRSGLSTNSRDVPQGAHWGRPQQPDVYDAFPAPRSPNRRPRHKEDIEPSFRRRKDDVEVPVRRRDDNDPSVRRKDDIETPVRRKDDIGPWHRRKDDIEPPLRRKDDVEPPLPRKQPSVRHVNHQWPASRPRSPPPHTRAPSPPRRGPQPPFPPATGNFSVSGSSNARDPPRYERSNSPPRYPPRDIPAGPSNDGLPMRRGRDADIAEYGYDGSKRRRLNDEPGASRRPPSDFPPAIASLPAKPSFPPDSSSIDASHRKRAPLPPQDQEWRENMNQPSVPGPPSYVPVVGARYDRPPENVGRKVYDVPLDRRDDRLRPPLEDGPSGPRRAGRSPLREVDTDHSTRPQPTGPNERSERRSRFDAPPPPPDRMDVDAPPPSRAPPPARLIGGGMHADRMLAEPPRGPRAMAPRDGPFTAHGSISSSVSAPAMSAPYNARAGAPMTDNVSNDRGRGRSGPSLPAGERRWETNDSGRRESFSGPPGEPLGVPPRRIDDRSGPPRDLLDRPRVSSSAADDRRGDRSLSRMTGTNNVLTGGRPSGYASDTSAPNAMHSPVERYRAADNAFGDPSRFIAPGEPEPFDRRRQQRPPPDLPPPRSSRDRRSSVTQDVGIQRPRGPDPVPDRPMIALPPRPRETLRDNAPPRQSRFGPPGAPPSEPPDLAPRIWQTRDEAQNARTQEARPNDGRGPRDEVRPPREGNAWESHPEPASQRWWPGNRDRYAGGPGGSENAGPRTRSPEIPLRRRASPPPPPAVTEGRRYDDQAIERPGTNKVHPSRAPLVEEVPTHEAFGRAPRPNRPRYPDRSPEQGYADRMRRGDIDRDLPPRPAEDAYLAPPRDRSPSSSQNDLRPNMRRGGSLLERLSLDDDVARHDGGSSLRERVDIASHGNNDEAAFAHADSMDVDADGNPLLDDPFKGGGRGQGRRRGGKPKRGRRNGA